MESAGQYLQWHPTSRVGLYSYSRLWSLWDSVVGVCSSPMGLTGHLAWEDRKEQHENILPLRPPWSAAILSSCLPELNHSSACVHLWEEDIKRDGGFVCVTPQMQACRVSDPQGARETLALRVQAARGSQNLITDTITTARGFTRDAHLSATQLLLFCSPRTAACEDPFCKLPQLFIYMPPTHPFCQ